MTELFELLPTQPQRVIDLVSEAGMDVSDWANMKGGQENAAWNPRYCYEWSFIDPEKMLILNLWYKELELEGETIIRRHNIRKVGREEGLAGNSKRKTRANNMDTALQIAWKRSLPVRVIICDSALSDTDNIAEAKVSKRLLDPIEWGIKSYNMQTGDCILVRGLQAKVPIVDQFSTIEVAEDLQDKRTVTSTVYFRDPKVREQVRQRSEGFCEHCKEKGFDTCKGIYIETHHIIPLAEGGPDTVRNVIALCPNHHMEAHYGVEKAELRKKFQLVIEKLYSENPTNIENSFVPTS